MGFFLLASLMLLGGVTDGETLRFRYTGEQGFDDSCGLQVLASLLRGYRGDLVEEVDLILLLPEARKGRGRAEGLQVSLADLQGLAALRGHRAAAYRLELKDLPKALSAYPPVLLHLAKPMGHFVLLVAIHEDWAGRVYVVADPARGMAFLPEADLAARWSGGALVVAGPTGPGACAEAGALGGQALGRRALLLAGLAGGCP